jgi:hypothetical protein
MPYKALEQQRNYQAVWMWRRRMAWVLEHGPCNQCGTSQDLQVVYKDPKDKKVRVSAIWSRREEVRAELLKLCIVLCRLCASSKRTEERQPAHGTASRHKQGCRCDPCKAAKAAEMAAYRARRKERTSARTRQVDQIDVVVRR